MCLDSAIDLWPPGHFHRTKSHASAFLKCDGNIEFHIRFVETCYTKSWQFIKFPSCFRNGNFMSCFSQDVSAVVRFRYVSANGFLISLLNLCNENKLVMVLCIVFTILTKLKR